MSIQWETGDTCSACGHDGMTFVYERTAAACDPYGDPSIEYWGRLLCGNPACNVADEVAIDCYQVPDDKVEDIMEEGN